MSSTVSSVIARKESISNLIKASSQLDFYLVYPRSKSWPPAVRNRKNNICRMLVLDSSFNPPTKAHAQLVHAAKNAYPNHYFDATLLLFSTNNVDKKLTGASVEQRVQMMELMAHGLGDDDVAVGLTPHGKFIDKATHISRWFQSTNEDDTTSELYFIIGYDTMIRLMDAKYYVPLSVKDALAPFFEKGCHLICADRPNEDDEELFWKNTFDMFGKEKIKRIELDPVTAMISSTKVRSDVDHTDMAHDDILEFIQKSNLYK